jgi:acetylornithine/N-succinyldiaminopimelate aminotransferase
VLDVMLAPGFFEQVRHSALLVKQKLASIVDRYPDVVSEVRGEGLLIGLKAVVPAADLVGALRDEEKLLTVSAGENVVRLLPPLIVTEAEIEDAVSRIERVCARASRAPARRGAAR